MIAHLNRHPERTRVERHFRPLVAGIILFFVIFMSLTALAGRPPLFWDEAVRVRAGQQLVEILRGSVPGNPWAWLNAQVFYPPLLPLMHGAALALGASPLLAGVWPSLAAYVISGLMIARLARRLGLSQIGALAALVVFMSLTMAPALAASAETESVGAAALLVLLDAIITASRRPSAKRALYLALIMSLTILLKYDYALLGLGLLGLATLARMWQRRSWRSGAIGGGLALSLLFAWAWLSIGNSDTKWAALHSFIFQAAGNTGAPGAIYNFDLLHFPVLFLTGSGLGMGLPIVGLIILSGLFLRGTMAREPAWLLVIGTIGGWYLMYALASIQWPRYLFEIAPLLALLAGLAVAQLWARRSAQNPRRQMAGFLLVFLLAIGVGGQMAALVPNYSPPLYYGPNPTSDWVLAQLVKGIGPGPGPVIYLGISNQVSPAALETELHAGGSVGISISTIGELPTAQRAGALSGAIRLSPGCRVAAVTIPVGSPLYTGDYRSNHPSEATYVGAAQDLAASGQLRPLLSAVLPNGTEVAVYACLK